MVEKEKILSNPFSTGGGGVHFEARVQASFVTLMLTCGYVPCLPCWPISEIKLQGKVNGFDTDDLIVIIENPDNKEQRKLLAQIKYSISCSGKSKIFREVIRAAWNDFNNPQVFTKNKDIIALITGPLSKTDRDAVWLSHHARSHDAGTFFRNVRTAKFCSNSKRDKLNSFRSCLKIANGGIDVDDDETHSFLKHFYILGYDLSEEEGVVLSLINSHISQFERQSSRFQWSRILDFTCSRNHHAGHITRIKLPDDLTSIFFPNSIKTMPEAFIKPPSQPTNWFNHPYASYLARAVLIGSWDEKNSHDVEFFTKLLGIDTATWNQNARQILNLPDSPLSINNGIWKVDKKKELWDLLGSYILDQDLDNFKLIAVTVLKEKDPAFELPAAERYLSTIRGKNLQASHYLRSGITEGLAILGTRANVCCHCSLEKATNNNALTIAEIFNNADWMIWGGLNSLLPNLAEASPREFLVIAEEALNMQPCPFDEIFAQEGEGFVANNYITGLLTALEVLAWDPQYLVRACMLLAGLASHDPGGQFVNRPINSLIKIFLPWLPQTVASVEKRYAALKTIFKDYSKIGWDLIIELLPGKQLSSVGSQKPSWLDIIPEGWENKVTNIEYWDQIEFFSKIAVQEAAYDIKRLIQLIDNIDRLTSSSLSQLIEVLQSDVIFDRLEEDRIGLWEHLIQFIDKQKACSGDTSFESQGWLNKVEDIANILAPKSPFQLYRHLFSMQDYEFYEKDADWEEQQKLLTIRRDAAIKEIYQSGSVETIIQFAESVVFPETVGLALGSIEARQVEKSLLPRLLDNTNPSNQSLIRGFVWRKHQILSWIWSDEIDKSEWTCKQIAIFLTLLPFNHETWERVSLWLRKNQKDYWSRTTANTYQVNDKFNLAIQKLIRYGRPHAAIRCLYRMLAIKLPINLKQCAKVLILATSSKESKFARDEYHIVELIKYLQLEPSTNEEELLKIEWAYLPLLEVKGIRPQILESRLADDPEFFCEIIRHVYRSENEDENERKSSDALKIIAINAWRLLQNWKTPPGLQKNGVFIAGHFSDWLQKVKKLCSESGHLKVALYSIGEVLIYTPPDPNGLWIDKTVAAALDNLDTNEMRTGFKIKTYNSRGVHTIDPDGRTEKELAALFHDKAEQVENCGFPRLSSTLRDIAKNYELEAKRIINQFQE